MNSADVVNANVECCRRQSKSVIITISSFMSLLVHLLDSLSDLLVS